MTDWTMNYAPHLGIRNADTPLLMDLAGSTDPLVQIAFIGDLGFRGVEDNCLKHRPVAVQEKIGEALSASGMRLGCIVNHAASKVRHKWGVADEDEVQRIQADLAESFAALGRAGGHSLTVTSAQDPAIPRGYQLAQFIETLKRVADPAAEAGVVLCLEAVSWKRMADSLLNRISDAALVARAVNHPAVRLVFDVFHVSQMDGDVLYNLDACWDLVEALQIADVPDRTEAGTGELDWVRILSEIKARGYGGLVELEHGLASPGHAGAERFLERLRSIDRQLD